MIFANMPYVLLLRASESAWALIISTARKWVALYECHIVIDFVREELTLRIRSSFCEHCNEFI